MKILIVRHGDPNYENDCLTDKGRREAELLAKRLCKEDIKAVYCSTLGRARETAQPTLDALGMEADYCEWLREFDYARVTLPHGHDYCWDILPQDMQDMPKLYDSKAWRESEFFKNTDVIENFDNVTDQFDRVLQSHGYERFGTQYKAIAPNHDTILFVCHYGLSCVLLSHILNCSPYALWQHTCLPTTSVTTLYTEERRDGIASLRSFGMGDISHLYIADEPAAFSARFCEVFTDNTRHD